MNTEDGLRSVLEQVPVPATRVTVDGLLHAGHRRVRQRRVATTGGIAVLAAVVVVLVAGPAGLSRGSLPAPPANPSRSASATPSRPVPTAATGRCSYTTLAAPAGRSEPEPESVSPNGKYIVGHVATGQNFTPVIWTDRVPHAVPIPHGADSAGFYDVNSSGVASGDVSYGQFAYPTRYADGVLRQLKLPAGGPWYLLPNPKINEAGTVMAHIQPIHDPDSTHRRVLIYPPGSDTPQVIPWPDDSWVYDIADDGTLIGEAGRDQGNTGFAMRAYAWDAAGQHGHPLSTPDGQHSSAHAVRGDWVAGQIGDNVPPTTPKPGPNPTPDLSHVHAALWNLRTGELVVLPAGAAAETVSGNALATIGRIAFGHGVAVSPTEVYDLAMPAAKFNPFYGGVSDTGLIVGFGWDLAAPDGVVEALTWQC